MTAKFICLFVFAAIFAIIMSIVCKDGDNWYMGE